MNRRRFFSLPLLAIPLPALAVARPTQTVLDTLLARLAAVSTSKYEAVHFIPTSRCVIGERGPEIFGPWPKPWKYNHAHKRWFL